MDIKIESTTEIILSLDQKEAQRLKAMVQNPMPTGPIPYDYEEPEDMKRMRKTFWDALNRTW